MLRLEDAKYRFSFSRWLFGACGQRCYHPRWLKHSQHCRIAIESDLTP